MKKCAYCGEPILPEHVSVVDETDEENDLHIDCALAIEDSCDPLYQGGL
jgi:hypothetical protein